jgi:hypothetical protein
MIWKKNKTKSCDSLVYDAGWNDALYRVREVLMLAANTKKEEKETEKSMSTLIDFLKR